MGDVIRVTFRAAAPETEEPKDWYDANGWATLKNPKLCAALDKAIADSPWWHTADHLVARDDKKRETTRETTTPQTPFQGFALRVARALTFA